jgi:hypothetical protein
LTKRRDGDPMPWISIAIERLITIANGQ